MDYKVVISPNIRISYKNGNILLKNHFNKNSVLFKGQDIITILNLFDEPQYINIVSSALIDTIPDIFEIIKSLIEWDFLIIDLELSERSCPLCKSTNSKILIEHENKYYRTNFFYVRCNKCEFVFLNPAPPENVLNFFYAYKNFYSIIPIHSVQKFEIGLQLKSNRLRARLLESYFPLNNSTNVLDVGSGTGNFASYLSQKYNCIVTCVDKDAEALNFIKQNYPQLKTLETDFKYSVFTIKYDIITMWGFIEHESLPIDTLKKAYNSLKLNGYIIIDAPNINGKLARKSLVNWPYLHSPYHLCHYEPKTLSKILEITGFKVIDIKYRKTGTYLLKYSENILFLLYKFKLFYSSNLIDSVIFYLSRLFLPFEKSSDNRFIITAQKI